MTYEEALTYIHSVIWKGKRVGLSRITELLERQRKPLSHRALFDQSAINRERICLG